MFITANAKGCFSVLSDMLRLSSNGSGVTGQASTWKFPQEWPESLATRLATICDRLYNYRKAYKHLLAFLRNNVFNISKWHFYIFITVHGSWLFLNLVTIIEYYQYKNY